MQGRLGVFDLSHVELTDAADRITRMNDCGSFPLSSCQNNVHELFAIWDNLNLLEVVESH